MSVPVQGSLMPGLVLDSSAAGSRRRVGRERCTDGRRPPAPSLHPRFHRDTQTVDTTTRSQQTRRECGTQMARPDLLVEDKRDVYITPHAYFDSEQLADLWLRKVCILLCMCVSVGACDRACMRPGRTGTPRCHLPHHGPPPGPPLAPRPS